MDAAWAGSKYTPLRLKLGKDLALGVVAKVADIDEAAQVEACGSEMRHGVLTMGRESWLRV